MKAKDRERERERDREAYKERNRETERGGGGGRERERERNREIVRQTDRQISAEQDSGLIDWQSRPGSPGSGERYQEPVGADLLLVNVSHHHLDEGYLSVLKWVVSVVIQVANGE